MKPKPTVSPAVIDGIVGMKAADTKTVTETFADDFKIEELRGKTGEYAITVHEVRERILPALDEEFLKTLQLESVEELKGRMLDNLENQKKNKAAEAQRAQIIDQLLGAVDFPLPETAIEGETRNVMGRIMMENMQRGVAEEDFEQNKEALHAQSSQIAARDVKLRFVLSKIAQAEKITVEQEDLSPRDHEYCDAATPRTGRARQGASKEPQSGLSAAAASLDLQDT